MEGNPTSRTAHFYDVAYARLCYTDVETDVVNTVIASGTNTSPPSDCPGRLIHEEADTEVEENEEIQIRRRYLDSITPSHSLPLNHFTTPSHPTPPPLSSHTSHIPHHTSTYIVIKHCHVGISSSTTTTSHSSQHLLE